MFNTIAVLGGGSFGTALANLSANNGFLVNFWMRDEKQAQHINENRTNPKYLKDIPLSKNIFATNDLVKALQGVEFVILSIPSSQVRNFATTHKTLLEDKIIVSTIKGIEKESFKTISEVLKEVLPNAKIGSLSGPNLAGEIAQNIFSSTVVASDLMQVCKTAQQVLHNKYLRVYTSDDVFGVELGGALKNMYAIMIGLATSQNAGENTKSALITRALAEMTRFSVALGANPLTFLGLSGVGDLILTCFSEKSRNFRIGFALGTGKSLEEAQEEIGEVAEGVNTIATVYEKAKQMQIEMPAVNTLYALIFQKKPLNKIIYLLVNSHAASEMEADFITNHWNIFK